MISALQHQHRRGRCCGVSDTLPRGAAREGEPKVVFGAALEQAEQLFAAAESVTPATSPLLLFYGLSQAGRAVAAAAAGRDNADKWQLRGHGITNEHPSTLEPETFSLLTLRPVLRTGAKKMDEIFPDLQLSET
jgi:hypothetical protein